MLFQGHLLFVDNESAGGLLTVLAEDAERVAAGTQGAKVELHAVAVDLAHDDLLAYGIKDLHHADGLGAFNVEEPRGGIRVEVGLEGVDVVDAQSSGDSNPTGGRAVLGADHIKTHVGVAVHVVESDAVGSGTDCIGVVEIPFIGADGEVGLGMEHGAATGQENPFARDGDDGSLINCEFEG